MDKTGAQSQVKPCNVETLKVCHNPTGCIDDKQEEKKEEKSVEMQAYGNGQHGCMGWSYLAYLWGKGDSQFFYSYIII